MASYRSFFLHCRKQWNIVWRKVVRKRGGLLSRRLEALRTRWRTCCILSWNWPIDLWREKWSHLLYQFPRMEGIQMHFWSTGKLENLYHIFCNPWDPWSLSIWRSRQWRIFLPGGGCNLYPGPSYVLWMQEITALSWPKRSRYSSNWIYNHWLASQWSHCRDIGEQGFWT